MAHKGFSREQLKECFDAMVNPNDWRDAIAATMPGEAVTLAVAAIEFFTATTPRVALDTNTMRYLVTSEGYRMGPAGP